MNERAGFILLLVSESHTWKAGLSKCVLLCVSAIKQQNVKLSVHSRVSDTQLADINQ